MRAKTLRRKRCVVDGRNYVVSITALSRGDQPIDLRVTIQANFGWRSVCIIRGLKNYGYYRNYGYWQKPDYSERRDTVSVTPRLIAELIRWSHRQGWTPECCKSNARLEMDNETAKALVGG